MPHVPPSGRIDATLREAEGLLRDGHAERAIPLLEPLATGGSPDPLSLHLLAAAHWQAGGWAKAVELALAADRIRPHAIGSRILARAARTSGRTDECLGWLDRARRLDPGDPDDELLRIEVLEEAGRVDEAEAGLAALPSEPVESDPGRYRQRRTLEARILVQRRRYAEACGLIDETLGELDPGGAERRGLLYLRAKALDRAGHYDEAWASAAEANAANALPYDPALHARQVDALIGIWNASNMAEFPRTSCASETPVFVAGMPRSGTSLIDRIVDAHPKAAGVGELDLLTSFAMALSPHYDPAKAAADRFGPFTAAEWNRAATAYLDRIGRDAGPGAERIVEKSLSNDKLLGLIGRLFPKARIIHAIRDPRDVAVSCFMGGFNDQAIPWTVRPEWVAHAWIQSRRLMDHWKAILDLPILEVRYERLVADPAREFPRLVAFLGLDWDERCLAFHGTGRTLRTLSYDQVNQPLYTSSVRRWERYARYLDHVDWPEDPGVG